MTEREIFLSALEIEDPATRQTHVRAACAGDTALLARVEALLSLNDSHSQFLETPVMQQMAGGPDAGSAPTIMFGDGSTEDQEVPTEVSFDQALLIGEKRDDEPDEIPLGYLQPSDKPGSLGRLAHYEVLQVLGRGAFGIVLKALDEKLQRVVAIKVLAPEIAATSPARKRFLREARASGAIRHEHVVSIHAVDEKPLPYLVMEYIPGQTLQQRLDERGPLDIATTVRFARQIAAGLAAAHGKDLIHRDIKPGNILLEEGVVERVKITDFGLARAADDASMTQSGLIAGTPMYMAPEQALGKKLDQRADLFSMGSVLYQMVSGRPPFRASGTLAVLKRVTEDEPRPIQEIIPETPAWLCDLIARLHAKNPDDRYQSAREVADVLADCEEQLKTHGRLKDFSKIPRRKPAARAGRWKWIAAMLLLPAIALATTEMLGISHLFQKLQQEIAVATPDFDRGFAPQVAPQAEPSASTSPPSLAIAPFDAAQAGAHQEAWARHLGVPVEVTNSIGMKFRLIPPGEFMMGTRVEDIDRILAECPEWASHSVRDEAPQRRVVIDKAFYLGATEVTIGQFREFVRTTDYKTADEASGAGGLAHVDGTTFAAPEFTWRHPYVCQSDDHPMAQMTASDVEAFCRWLGKLDGKTYDLPSDEQWEHACRAGTTTFWSFGDSPAEFAKYAWANEHNAAASRPVGLKLPNPFGLYDIHGNVEELCRHVSAGYRARSGHVGNHVLLSRSAYQPNFGSPGSISWRQRGFRLVLDSAIHAPGGAQAKAIPVTRAKQEVPLERVALEFDGVNSYVATPLLYDGSTPLTVEVAVQIREWPVHKQQYHSEIVGCTEQAGFGLGTSKEGFYFSALIGTNYATVYSAKDDLYLNRPIKLAGMIDGQSLRLFIDGKQVARNGFEHRFKPSPEKISLGTSPGNGKPNDGNGYDWAGKMFEVRISNTARYTVDYDASTPLTADGNTMALYRFDEGSGDVLHDASDNGRHGKIVGGHWVNAGSPRTGPPSATTPSTFKNSIGIEFVVVPKGKSWLGGGKDKPGDREVEIAADFYLGKFEVTQAEWQEVMGENPSYFSRTGGGSDAVKEIPDADLKRFPVEAVSWDQCQVFVARLNRREKESGWVYRLPTEVEWEYACRGGPLADKLDSACNYCFGRPTNALLAGLANFNSGTNEKPIGWMRTCQVGSYEPNHLGLCDLHGNVAEWCEDGETGDPGSWGRFHRSGSWNDTYNWVTATSRHAKPPATGTSSLGLRLVGVPSGAAAREVQLPAPPAGAALADADCDRRAAEYVLSIGGWVKIDDQEQKIQTVADLPREPFRLTVLDLAQNRQVSDAGLAIFKDCRNVKIIALYYDSQVTDAGLAHFQSCKTITQLHLQGTSVTDAGLAIFQDSQSITDLYLSGPLISDTGLACFKNCQGLGRLSLSSTLVSDAGLAQFKDMPLRMVWINNTRITDLTPLQRMPLYYLRLTPKNITKGLENLRGIQSLQNFGVDSDKECPPAEFWERYDKGEFAK